MKLALAALLLFQVSTLIISWEMDCDQYWEAVQSLRKDPYFAKVENRQARAFILRLYKARTDPSCYVNIA